MAAKKYSNNEIKSMLDTLENKLLSPETVDLGSFYRSGILNYKGKSREGDFYTELVSQWLLSKTDEELEKLLLAKAEIKEEKEWPAEPIHSEENIDFSINSNRVYFVNSNWFIRRNSYLCLFPAKRFMQKINNRLLCCIAVSC